jgi:hypothetical protein
MFSSAARPTACNAITLSVTIIIVIIIFISLKFYMFLRSVRKKLLICSLPLHRYTFRFTSRRRRSTCARPTSCACAPTLSTTISRWYTPARPPVLSPSSPTSSSPPSSLPSCPVLSTPDSSLPNVDLRLLRRVRRREQRRRHRGPEGGVVLVLRCDPLSAPSDFPIPFVFPLIPPGFCPQRIQQFLRLFPV